MTPQYTMVDPVTGKRKSFSACDLTGNLQMDCVLFRGDEHIGIITRRDLVFFTWWCASETLTQVKGAPDQRVTSILAMVERWLEDEKSVSSEELKAATDAAWVAARVASAARPSAWAAAWTGAAHAAAARAAWAAAWTGAAHAAAEAAACAAGAAGAARAAGYISYEVQVQWLVEHLQSGK